MLKRSLLVFRSTGQWPQPICIIVSNMQNQCLSTLPHLALNLFLGLQCSRRSLSRRRHREAQKGSLDSSTSTRALSRRDSAAASLAPQAERLRRPAIPTQLNQPYWGEPCVTCDCVQTDFVSLSRLLLAVYNTISERQPKPAFVGEDLPHSAIVRRGERYLTPPTTPL